MLKFSDIMAKESKAISTLHAIFHPFNLSIPDKGNRTKTKNVDHQAQIGSLTLNEHRGHASG